MTRIFLASHAISAALAVVWCRPAFASEIHDAAASGELQKMKFLIQAQPALVNARDANGQTPLELAATNNRKHIAEALLSAGADVNAKDNGGWTPLHMAAAGGHRDIIALLLAKSAAPNVQAKDNATPFIWATARGQKEAADLLLAAGADVNARDNFGQTPLHYAAFKGYTDIVAVLLAKGADVKVRNNEGSTPLHLAAVSGARRIAQLLLASGAEPNVVDKQGRTAWQLAVVSHHTDVAALLSHSNVAGSSTAPITNAGPAFTVAIAYKYSCSWLGDGSDHGSGNGVTPPTGAAHANQKMPPGLPGFPNSKRMSLEIEFQTIAPLSPNGAAIFPQILDISYGTDHYRSDTSGVKAATHIYAVDPTTQLPSRWKIDIEAKLPDGDRHSFGLSDEKNERYIFHRILNLSNMVTRSSGEAKQCTWSKKP